MEIKDTLNKPYSETERLNFIVENNHNMGYEIRETDEALEAWGFTENELLEQTRAKKKNEALQKAYEYINNGAVFEYEEGKHIEANDATLTKLRLQETELILKKKFDKTIEWCTFEDEKVILNLEQLDFVVEGLKAEQTRVWIELYPEFLAMIKQAQSVEELNAIVIDYKEIKRKLKARKK